MGGAELTMTLSGGAWVGLPAEAVEREERDDMQVLRSRILWEDLALMAEDRRRLAEALREEQERNVPRRVADVDLRDLREVERQRLLWLRTIAQAHGERRRTAALELGRLLDGALRLHPREFEFAATLIRLLIDELRDGEAAVDLVRRVLANSPSDLEHWQLLKRESLALVGAAPLAEALLEASVVPRRDSDAAARDIVALTAHGMDYATAEGLFVAFRTVSRRARALRPRRVRPSQLPMLTLFQTVATLASLADSEPLSFYVGIRGAIKSWGEPVWNAETTPLVWMPMGGGASWLAGAVSTDRRDALVAMGYTAVGALEPGPIDVVLHAVPMGGNVQQPAFTLRITGSLQDDVMTVERAVSTGAPVDWSLVSRYLGKPLEQIRTVFPIGELAIDMLSRSDLSAFLDAASLEALPCRSDGLRVRCRAQVEDAGATRRTLLRFARDRLGTLARQLVGRPARRP